MPMTRLKQFYFSRPWLSLSYNLKIRSGGKCNRCDFIAVTKEDWGLLVGHHKTELTEENVHDTNISLNPTNIEIICLNCHNKDHRRFGHQNDKKVYIVYGPPLAGKTTAVKQMMRQGDLILDIDALWQAITYQTSYIKPNNCRFNVFKVRDSLLDQIKTRYGQWYDAYVIGGYPDKYERERLAKELGAELIYIEATKEECLQRLQNSNKPPIWQKYIEDWWRMDERYTNVSCGTSL